MVGTAGHVDHGKSTLIHALTGIDPDRLREERERGMTIDLGFAWLTLADGAEVGIVDVPGHQDFIRNMLAGVGSIDAVILVVALDEGVMPQTREHLAILELLGVDRGVVALTKRDLVDDEWAALVRTEVRAALLHTPLAAAPFCEVSASTGRGLDDLKASLAAALGAAPPRRDLARPRLPVDRAFTMSGFGTVVTGTLLDGSLAVGDEVALQPGERRARIRGLQSHRRAIEIAHPGSRVAVNLTGVDRAEVERGMVIARPGTLVSSSLLGLRCVVLASAAAPLGHDDQVKVHVGTAETIARVSILEGRELAPGASGWIQLRLATPVAVAVGDRLVLRRPSPSETIGGGVVADLEGERLRRRADTVAALERRSAPSPADRLLAALDVARTPAEAGERSGLGSAERVAALASLVAEGRIVSLGDAILARDGVEALALKVERMLQVAHGRNPLRAGAPREEVRGVTGLAAKRFTGLVGWLVAEGRIADRGSLLSLAGFRPMLLPAQEAIWLRVRDELERDLLKPPAADVLEREFGLDRELAAALETRGDLIRIEDSLFAPAAILRFGSIVIAELVSAGRITVGRARDLSSSSRKHVLPLLQYLDVAGLTRRDGDVRLLVYDADEARARLRAALKVREDRA